MRNLRMAKSTRLLMGALLVAAPGLVALAQVSPPRGGGEFSPPLAPPAPATAPATPRPPSATVPTTDKASALPTPQSVLENLINDRPPAATTAPNPAATNPALHPAVEATAPNEPKATRMREGQWIWKRTGHLVKDDKTGTFLFAFDADGKGMADPPMALVPSHLLMSMEDASEKGTRPVRFRVSGEVTEYRGKNYLLIRDMQAVRDFNSGIGG
jgi:hypothetical protein